MTIAGLTHSHSAAGWKQPILRRGQLIVGVCVRTRALDVDDVNVQTAVSKILAQTLPMMAFIGAFK